MVHCNNVLFCRNVSVRHHCVVTTQRHNSTRDTTPSLHYAITTLHHIRPFSLYPTPPQNAGMAKSILPGMGTLIKRDTGNTFFTESALRPLWSSSRDVRPCRLAGMSPSHAFCFEPSDHMISLRPLIGQPSSLRGVSVKNQSWLC